MTSKIYYFLLFIIGSLGNMPFTSAMDPGPSINFIIRTYGNHWSTQDSIKKYERIIDGLKAAGLFTKGDIDDYLTILRSKLTEDPSGNVKARELYSKLRSEISKHYSPKNIWRVEIKILKSDSQEEISETSGEEINLFNQLEVHFLAIKLNKVIIIGIVGTIILFIGIGCYIVYKSVKQAPSVKKTQKKEFPKKSGKKRSPRNWQGKKL